MGEAVAPVGLPAVPPEPAEQPQWPSMPMPDCKRVVENALDRNMVVKFMVDKLAEAGCAVQPNFFEVETCPEEVGGGFRPPDGVVICHNRLGSRQEIETALVHELVHAYDHCRAANLDWNNCEHHACSEVRAASLSGDCTYRQEFLRGHWRIQGQHQTCVRRRAELSVSMNPACTGSKARRAIDSVFETCFKDTAPFDRRP